MAIHVYDTFTGAAGDLLAHVGEVGATWTRHPSYPADPGNANTWLLSGEAGTVYSPVSNYVFAMYLCSGVPASATNYDIQLTYRVKSFGYSVGYGIVFDADAASDNYHFLHFSAHELRWELSRRTPGGGGYALGNSPQAYTPALDTNRQVRIERRTSGVYTLINVYVDGVLLISGLDDDNTGGTRCGLEANGIGNATATTGFHVKAFAAGDAGFTMPTPPEEPVYTIAGPTAGAPDFDSSAFTAALVNDENPGSITITPACAGVTGSFTPASVTLTDASRSTTFLFSPTSTGTATISFANGSGLVNVVARTYLAAYAGPEREAFWAGNLATDPTSTGPYVAPPAPYPDGGGYYLEGDDHYDPIECFYKIDEYATRKGLTPSSYAAQIEAAVIRFRDRGVLALNSQWRQENGDIGVQGHHRTLWGVVRHYFHTSDPVDLDAVDVLLPYAATVDEAAEREFNSNVGPQREIAFMLAATIDLAVIGRGEDARTDVYCDLVLGHIAQWVEPRATRRYGTALKPWMGGIGARALIMYWERYRNSAVPAKAALAARIPDALKAFADYLYAGEVWLPAQGGGGGYGCIKYRDLGPDDPLYAPLEGLAVTQVGANPRRVFRGPATLSAVDDHYIGAAVKIGGSQNQIDGYVGSTREITVNARYPVPFDVTTAMTFAIEPPFYQEGALDGAAAALNPMVFPVFAWCYWHERRVVGDFAASKRFRIMAHDCFNGSAQMWGTAWDRKQWSQAAFWTTDGLAWLERGDAEWPAATTYILEGPATGSAGDAGVASGAFRLSVPYGQRLADPTTVTPASGSGLGTFTAAPAVLSDDRRFAMFTFTPALADDGTIVDVTGASALTDPGAEPYAVGDVGDPDPDVGEEFAKSASASFTLAAAATSLRARATTATDTYAGRYQVGGEVALHVQCATAAGAAAVPAAAPVARVYRDGVLVAALRLPLDDDPGATGRFRGRLALGDGHAPGRHAVVYHYALGAVTVAAVDTFEVAPGGDADGVVQAVAVLARPDGDAVLTHLGSGRLMAGRTPYLDEGI